MTRFPNQYPANWREISLEVKREAGWRCVRCHHPFAVNNGSVVMECDDRCDAVRGVHRKPLVRNLANADVRLFGLSFTVHHMDGDKANSAWWNLLALCNSCHLTVQSRVIVERPWILAHSEWFVPYVAGFYASYHGGLVVTRDEVMADPVRYLAMGQPLLYPAQVSR